MKINTQRKIIHSSLFIALLAVLVWNNCSADNTNAKDELNNIIQTHVHPYVTQNIQYDDYRPLYVRDTKEVSNLLHACFESRFINPQADKMDLREKALKLFYKHSRALLEDGSDAHFTKLNRSAVLASLSLISDVERQELFLEDAIRTLSPYYEDFQRHHKFYLMLGWIYTIEEGDREAITLTYTNLQKETEEKSNSTPFSKIIHQLYSYCEKRNLFIADKVMPLNEAKKSVGRP